MTQAISSQGAQLKRAGVLIPEIKTFNGPTGTAAEVDVTSLDSLAREYLQGLKDEGELSFTMNWVPQNSVHKALAADFAARTTSAYTLTVQDVVLSTLSFQAFVREFPKTGGVDAPLEASVTLRITGAVTESP